MYESLRIGSQWSADCNLRVQISEILEIIHYLLIQMLLRDDVLDEVG